jgi:hypothetical protein
MKKGGFGNRGLAKLDPAIKSPDDPVLKKLKAF